MYLATTEPAGIIRHCLAAAPESGDVFLILISADGADRVQELTDGLTAEGLTFAGGVFPALIDGTEIRNTGTIVLKFTLAGDVAVADISGEQPIWTSELQVNEDSSTLFVFGDYSCVAITDCLEELFDACAGSVNYFGGGAGTGNRVPAPVLFSHHGVHIGSAVVVPVSDSSVVQLRHGWTRLSEPIVATRSRANIIETINWQPASEVYEEIVGPEVAGSLRRGDNVPQAKRYPFGIARSNAEDVVRDPLMMLEDGGLMVLSGVQQHSMLRVLVGEDEKLIAAARELGESLAETKDAGLCLLFDCYSRAMLYGENIDRELKGFNGPLQNGEQPCQVFGAMALGEIASNGADYPDFHNKTIAGCMLSNG